MEQFLAASQEPIPKQYIPLQGFSPIFIFIPAAVTFIC